MTRSRSARTSGRGGARRPGARRPSTAGGNQPQVMVIGGIGAAALIVVLVFAFGGKGSSGGAGTSDPSGASAPASTPGRTPAPSTSGGTARAGATPDRPAPAIDPADLALAKRHYDAGAARWNESQGFRNAGDGRAYAGALEAAFEELSKQREALRPYTDWYEEADLEGWALPAEYDILQRRLDEWDPLYQRVKKLKQAK